MGGGETVSGNGTTSPAAHLFPLSYSPTTHTIPQANAVSDIGAGLFLFGLVFFVIFNRNLLYFCRKFRLRYEQAIAKGGLSPKID